MRHFARWTALVCVGMVVGCGDLEEDEITTDSDELIGGVVVATDTWGSPWWGCSSTLVRDRWLLTAKHCMPSAGPPASLINGQSATMEAPIFHHPSLDVSLVHLSAPLTPSGSASTRGPYPLYKGSEAQFLNKTLYCQASGAPQAGVLQSANLLVTTVNTGLFPYCDGSPGCFRTAFTNGQHVAGGDSGGGCMLTSADGANYRRLVGVVSGTSGVEDFHVSAPWFRDWANGITGSAPTFGALTGYERADQFNAVVYRNSSNHLIELAVKLGGWQRGDLTTVTGAVNAVGNPTAFVRFDGGSSVGFRSSDNHIHELALQHGGTWSKRDLSSLTGAPAAAGNPISFGRSDRIGVVLYRSSSNKVIELSRDFMTDTWWQNDLTTIIGAPNAASDPVGYVRADGNNAVVYRSFDGRIRELVLPIGGLWSQGDLMTETGAPLAVGQPRPYTRQDGVSVVLYRSSDNHIRELYLSGGFWGAADLTALTGASPSVSDPFGYVRADGKAAVVFKTSDNHIRELTWSGTSWSAATDLTAATGAPVANGTGLSAYVRSTGISAVVFRTSDNHVHQLSRTSSSSTWLHVDLTNQVGGVI